MMNIGQTTPRYRRDVDGLRSLAVILVIAFHAGFGGLPSGFIGVDIFFVISGYLITGIILTQLQEKRFSLTNFFVGRLWRIQPALITVSLATLLAASILYVVPDYMSYLKSAKYNSLFISNQFFAKQSVAYASPQSEFFPLLHTWSLSIEWQWYLFLPLILTGASYLIKRFGYVVKDARKNDTKVISLWLIATAVLSGVSVAMSLETPGESYYFLMTRAFEFTAGGSAFLLNRFVTSVRSWLLFLLSYFSFAAIIVIAMKNGVIDIYPNIWTLAVVLATATLLFSGHYGEKGVSRYLSLSPVTFIGKLSYSLYLWHWPVFAISRYIGLPLTGYTLAIILAGIIVLSLGSYYFVETPLRKKRPGLKSTFILLILLPIILFTGLYSLGTKFNGFPQRLGADYAHRQNVIDEYLTRSGNRDRCLNNFDDPLKCQLGASNGTRTALVIGDSNSNHFWGFFDVLGKDADVKVSALSASSCLTLPGVWQYDWWIYKNIVYRECHERTKQYFQLIRQNHYNFVVIGEIWEQYAAGAHLINKEGDARSDALSKARMSHAIREAINVIISSGSRPVFIKTVYPMPAGYQECINHLAIKREGFENSSCNAPRKIGNENIFISSLFAQLKKEYPKLMIIDPKDIQCPGGECVSQIDSVPLYRDVGHLTDYASYRFGEIYLKKSSNPFNK